MMRAIVVINPIAGGGRVSERMAEARALAVDTLGACGLHADVHFTSGPGDAHRAARAAAADGCSLIVAWGGDGTVNEVASAVAFGRVPIGIVPAGSGNGLARDLGLPSDAVRALRVAANGVERVIDAGDIDGSLFFNIAGVGLDAAIAARFAMRGVRQRGRLGYLTLTTGELLNARALRYALEIGAERLERRALMITFANSRQYGNGALIAPAARLDDGRLELVVVEAQSLARIAWQLPSLFRGTLRDSRGLVMRSITTAAVAGDDGRMLFHVDGEPKLGGTRLNVRVRPRALTVRCSDRAKRS
jgi:diacylglycerol kinase (ATP)